VALIFHSLGNIFLMRVIATAWVLFSAVEPKQKKISQKV